MAEDFYLLGPGSLSWRLMKERVLLLGGGRMLMLQMGNPAVAEGVSEHSTYTSDPWGRVRHTTEFYLRLVHARSSDLPELRSYLKRAHRGIKGPGYDAEDMGLMLWVHATVSDSVLWIYQQIFGPLTGYELSRYWTEQRILAQAMGIDGRLIPASRQQWEEYVALGKRELVATPAAREVWRLICNMPGQGPRRLPGFAWWPLRRPVARASALATRVSMPPMLAYQLGVTCGPEDLVRFRRLCLLLRLLLPLTPPELRFSARARAAQALPAAPASRWA